MSAAPRILCLVETLGRGGGAEQLLATLLPEMRRRGADVEVVALFDWPDDLGEELEANGVPVHRLKISGQWALREGVAKLRKIMRNRRYDIFWGHLYFGNLYARLCQIVARRGRVAITMHSEGYAQAPPRTLRAKVRAAIERMMMTGAEIKVGVSDAVKADYQAYFGWNDVQVVHNGVDQAALRRAAAARTRAAVRRELGYRPRDFLIVTPARYIPKKGHPYLLDALEILAEERGFRPKLFLCGTGPLHDEIERSVKERGLDDRVVVAGVLPHDQLLPLIGAADAVVLPSLREPFGIAAAEAMALGKACVITRTDGFVELAGTGDNALLAEPGDARALANAIWRLRDEPGLAATLGANAKRRIAEHFDMPTTAANWLRVLNGLNGSAKGSDDTRSVLYLSYDGMTDQLGASQVLPYLERLARRGHKITLISFEKRGRGREERKAVASLCKAAGIDWRPLRYHKRPPILSAIADVAAMARRARRLHKARPFDIVHCRSYIPAIVGLEMKRRLGLYFLFDMRGFWADERIDGGQWTMADPVFRRVYHYFKRRESEFLTEADHVISLTEAGKEEILSRPDRKPDGPTLTVIPCCVDFCSFPPVTGKRRAAARQTLGIAKGRRVVTYLGSIGSWYMLDEMLDFFAVQLERDPQALFLIISREDPAAIVQPAVGKGLPEQSLMVRAASRDEVPVFVAAADYGLFFIKPVFSKKASSPTKMGELLALELPFVTNSDVGDVSQIVQETGAGVVVETFDKQAYNRALDQLASLPVDRKRWRKAARRWFDLDTGVERLDAIYREATTERIVSTSRGA